MFKKIFVPIIYLLIVFSFSCKKNTDNNYKLAIIGNWRYSNSTVDSLLATGQWTIPKTGYDSTVVDNFADSLQFTASDTVYYTYHGISTWSNYKVDGSNLVLIGGSANDTLIIHNINSSSLQIGTQNNYYHYWMNFDKY